MAQKSFAKTKPAWLPNLLDVVLCLAFALLGWVLYYTTGIESQEVASKAVIFKYVMVMAGLGMVALFWFGDLKCLRNLPSLLLIGYAAFSMLSVFWAVAGRLFIQRYSVVFTALFFFLYAVLRGRGDPGFMRRVMSICAGISTIYAVLSVELASTKLLKPLADRIFGEGVVGGSFGARLYGVFGNSNIEASFFALGVLFSLALSCGAEKKRDRALWMAALAINAYAMLLGVSLVAMACLVAAAVAYLIFAGEKRSAIFLHMVAAALCALAGAVVVSRLYASKPAILMAMLLVCAAACAALELLLVERLSAKLAAHEKLFFGILIGVLVLLAVYVFVGMHVSGPYTYVQGGWLNRSLALEPGEHTLQVDADTEMLIAIYSESSGQSVVESSERLFYEQKVKEAVFTVPEDSAICRFGFYSSAGQTIYSAVVDGNKQIVLSYKLFPGFIANRLGNPAGSNSLLQRQTYVRDGLKLFRIRPLAGLGTGAFESMVSSVQDYEYETNHSHNQYIETLLEGGVIGFALFLGTLVMLGIALWKARKKLSEGGLAWLYPAFCAEFVMSALQMLWDVSMSVTVFACMIYMLYGMIVSTCAESLALKKADAEQKVPAKKNTIAAKPVSDTGLRIACSVLPLLFVVSIGLNIHAQRLIRRPVETLDGFMTQLSRAEGMDLYENNDIKLSYVRAQMENDEEGTYYAQANEYARQLSTVRSNSIPYILVVYYLNTQQYGLAIEEAKAGAQFSASDSDAWNNTIDALKQVFIDSGAYSPLLNDDGTLLRGLTEYQEMLEARDAAALKPLALNENSVAFFDKLTQLGACNGDRDMMAAVLTAPPEE